MFDLSLVETFSFYFDLSRYLSSKELIYFQFMEHLGGVMVFGHP